LDSRNAADLRARCAHCIFAIHAMPHLVVDGVLQEDAQLFFNLVIAQVPMVERLKTPGEASYQSHDSP
jgi:hypothetical protein